MFHFLKVYLATVWLVCTVSFITTKHIKDVQNDVCLNVLFDTKSSSTCLVRDTDTLSDIASVGKLSDLDYFDFVAQKTSDDSVVLQPETPLVSTTQPPSVSTPAKVVVDTLEKPTTNSVRFDSPLVSNSEEKSVLIQSEESVSWFDFSAHLEVLFPDPFQAYVFSGLLFWLCLAIVLVRREWKKSSRIVLEVFLQQGPEAIQLVEDRYKDQLNLPGEYSLLS